MRLVHLLVLMLGAACGRSALTSPNSPFGAPSTTDTADAGPEPADGGSMMPPTNCRTIGQYAPIGFFAEHAKPDFTDAEYTSTSAWTRGPNVAGDTLWAAVVWARGGVDTGIVIPNEFELSSGTYASCTGCVIFCELNPANLCQRRYLARTGTMSVTEATRGPAGTFAASMKNVLFREWDLEADLPVTRGKCITVDSAELRGRF